MSLYFSVCCTFHSEGISGGERTFTTLGVTRIASISASIGIPSGSTSDSANRPSNGSGNSTSVGLILGGVIGVLFALVILILVVLCVRRKRRRRRIALAFMENSRSQLSVRSESTATSITRASARADVGEDEDKPDMPGSSSASVFTGRFGSEGTQAASHRGQDGMSQTLLGGDVLLLQDDVAGSYEERSFVSTFSEAPPAYEAISGAANEVANTADDDRCTEPQNYSFKI